MAGTRADGRGHDRATYRAARAAPESKVLEWLSDQAQDEGFVAVSARGLAADLGLRTVIVRGVLSTLAAEGLLHDIGHELYALAPPGGREDDAEPRSDPHRPVHAGSGGTALW
jgi:hypothetical protein